MGFLWWTIISRNWFRKKDVARASVSLAARATEVANIAAAIKQCDS
jgi:hypothetical protein